MTTNKLNEILDFIWNENIVCPMPDHWHHMWKEICGKKINHGHFDDDHIEIGGFMPLILSGWDSEDVEKHERFTGLIKHFYKNYPEKRILIEELISNNTKWLRSITIREEMKEKDDDEYLRCIEDGEDIRWYKEKYPKGIIKTKDDNLNTRYFRSDNPIKNHHASHNVMRWEWVGNDGKGRTFSEINKPNSFYRQCIRRNTYAGNETSIRQDLKYDIEKLKMIVGRLIL